MTFARGARHDAGAKLLIACKDSRVVCSISVGPMLKECSRRKSATTSVAKMAMLRIYSRGTLLLGLHPSQSEGARPSFTYCSFNVSIQIKQDPCFELHIFAASLTLSNVPARTSEHFIAGRRL